jgi:hypothetical protein
MAKTITSANVLFMLTVPGVINSSVKLEGFAADDAFSTDQTKPVEITMGVDGHMSQGWIPTPKIQKFKFAADSPSVDIFDAWASAMETSRDAFAASAVVTFLSTGKSYNCTNGALTGYMTMPGAKKKLDPLDYEITWESITGSNV